MNEIPKPDLELVFEHYGARILGADTGGWRKAECPLNEHEDRNPSASVNTDACRWICRACDKSGDAIDLIEENENVGFADALTIAQGFLGEGDGEVRDEHRSGGLLPARKGDHAGRGAFVPAWRRV